MTELLLLLLLQMVPVPLGLLCLCAVAAAGGSLRSAVCLCVCVLWPSSPRWSLCYPAPCPSSPSSLFLSHVSSPHHHQQHSPKCPSSFSSSSSSIQSKTVSVWPCLALICALKLFAAEENNDAGATGAAGAAVDTLHLSSFKAPLL